MSKKGQSFDEAFTELQTIVEQLKDEEIGIDLLSEKISRAKSLIKFTKEKLRSVEEDVKSIIDND